MISDWDRFFSRKDRFLLRKETVPIKKETVLSRKNYKILIKVFAIALITMLFCKNFSQSSTIISFTTKLSFKKRASNH